MPSELQSMNHFKVGYLSNNSHILWTSPDFSSLNLPMTEVTERQLYIGITEFKSALRKWSISEQNSETLDSLFEILDIVASHCDNHIKNAMTKKSGYISRLFSREAWLEWIEYKTALGRVITVFQDYLRKGDKKIFKTINKETVLKANLEAMEILKRNQEEESQEETYFSFFQRKVERINDMINSFIPLLPGASANEDTESTQCDDLSLITGTGFQESFSKIMSTVVNAIGDKIPMPQLQRIVEAINTVYLEQIEAWERHRNSVEAKINLRHYETEFDTEFQKREKKSNDFPSHEGYYFDEDVNVRPQFKSVTIKVIENGQEKCLDRIFAIPGYLRWSIYRNEWGTDTLVAEGTYNYDKKAGKKVEDPTSGLSLCR